MTLGAFGLVFVAWWYGRKDRPVPARFALVLGAKVFPDGTPSLALRRRAQRAADLWRADPATVLVLSGGTPDGRPTEAAVMARLLRAEGLPPAALHLEEESRTTGENARHCAAWLSAHSERRANLISDRFHLLRARQLFRAHGLEVGTLGVAPGTMPRFDRLYWLTREGLALLARPGLLLRRSPRRTEDWRGGGASR